MEPIAARPVTEPAAEFDTGEPIDFSELTDLVEDPAATMQVSFPPVTEPVTTSPVTEPVAASAVTGPIADPAIAVLVAVPAVTETVAVQPIDLSLPNRQARRLYHVPETDPRAAEAEAQVHVTCPLAIISVGGHVTGQKMHTATFNLPQPKPMAVPRHTIKRQELNHEIVTWGALLGMPARWMPPRIFDHRDTTY
jgi:hypothetical protein